MRRASLLALVCAAALVLSGCGAGHASSDSEKSWAADISATSAQASSDLERKVLSDGRITDAEYSELQAAILRCLDGLGLKASFDAEGTLTYATSRSTPIDRDAVQACNAGNGIRTITLRDAMRRNPSHLDEGKIMVDCLQRVHLVESSYTAEMYDSGVDMARISASPLFDECDAGPLHFEKK